MKEVKKEGYTEDQVARARRLIVAMMGVPKENQPLFTAVATAYIDGVEAGTRIAKEMKQAAAV
jgi:hypothetical protein